MKKSEVQPIHRGFRFKVSDVKACRICLATNVKLFRLQDTHLGNCIKSIGGFSTSSCGGLPNFVCYECAPTLLKCAKLIEKSKTAEATILNIIAKNGRITKPLIEREKKSQPDLKSSLDSYLLQNYYHITYDDSNQSSGHIETESKNNIETETDTSSMENKDGTNVIVEDKKQEDKKSVAEIVADAIPTVEIAADAIPTVEIESSDGEPTEEYISLLPHKSTENLEKCAKGISHVFQKKSRRRERKKNRNNLAAEFADIRQNFTTHKISIHGSVRCNVCRVGFLDEDDLFYHTERIHTYKFKCKYCSMLLNNVDDAKYHINYVCTAIDPRQRNCGVSNPPPTMGN
ncbi:hypothetical protein PYW08_004868 [Mythimna loreyi]|uniref:Uncharacterized protein n=1 Tax=Mythimna loreyi TaxID=667449 RepID=A0ACC2QDE2_9NEOP|nr:hypothetical protein PYW08_004868 [Mythimna loreyi]